MDPSIAAGEPRAEALPGQPLRYCHRQGCLQCGVPRFVTAAWLAVTEAKPHIPTNQSGRS